MRTLPSLVIQLPLRQLWRDGEVLSAVRGRSLLPEDIRALLQRGEPLQFVVANLGSPLRWVSVAETFDFWKADVRAHVADPDGFFLEAFPGEYAYVATEWLVDQDRIVLLEMHH